MEESRSIGPLIKDHVPGLERLLELYRSVKSYSDITEHRLSCCLCSSILSHLGINVYESVKFNQFIGIKPGHSLCRNPHEYPFDNSDGLIEECIKPRIEALEKIINYLQ